MRDPKSIVLAVVCAGAVLGAACGGDSGTTPAVNPLDMVVFAGAGQSAAVGHAVAITPAVRVTNHFGLPQFGIYVKFTVASGNGALDGDTQETDSSGIARPRSWTLGSAAKTDTVVATMVTSTGVIITSTPPITFTAIALATPSVRVR